MNTDMTTTKIDRESLEKLRLLAERESRSPPSQLAVLIDKAFRANPAEMSDEAFMFDAMDAIVDRVESGHVTDAARENSARAREAGVISWGSEGGKVIGTMADGTRCDIEGNVLAD